MSRLIRFTETDLAKTREFVIRGEGSRFPGTPSNIRMGKLGEIALAKFLLEHGKVLWTIDNKYLTMDDVYMRGRLNLQTSDGKTVDVKTSKRSLMLVPGDRAEDYYSHYYVGVQISRDETQGTIRGFASLRGLRESAYAASGGYEKKFESLVSINQLLGMMPESENDVS